ncbi:hypothetical protein I0D00_15480 [Pseudomonas lalucatii]|uniref:Uncharacterized protein n=1 Tax=Pseudomonas lalucatii TaxID=1424203 RepID=A0ABS5Q3I1_9PSED|nr:hypothetical protein [Pseudomonas lalucatii]MBS7663330.1 hypothetical protein [Pseudomonas lalucatii]MBS7689892.1 hypothetical protein [Pseudomonas lalucatii]MBS7724965.1 hypothetical protein [Pseudomonas lalucatii]QVM87068.1 hypothetical protein I0D68_16555 [Pseudomonas lalucatii]
MTTKGKVIHLSRRAPEEALERLNRITGLRFARWPESLRQSQERAAPAEPLQALEGAGGRGLESA